MKNLFLVLSIPVSFLVGVLVTHHFEQRKFAEEIQFVQAEKSDLFLSELEDVRKYLEAGCTNSAISLVSNKIDQNLMLLSEHVRYFPNGEYVVHLEKNDRVLLKILREHEIDWNKRYYVDECENSKTSVSVSRP